MLIYTQSTSSRDNPCFDMLKKIDGTEILQPSTSLDQLPYLAPANRSCGAAAYHQDNDQIKSFNC